MAELPPPPRVVHFISRYARDRCIALILSLCVVIGLAIAAGIQFSSYRALVQNGKAAWSVVQSRSSYTSSKGGTFYYLYYELPGSQETVKTSVDGPTYFAYPQGSYVTLTVDPSDTSHHVIGSATSEELGLIGLYWMLGILGTALLAGLIYLGIVITAKNQYNALARWDFAHAPVLHSRIYSGKSTSTSVTVEVPSTSRQIRTFTLQYAFTVMDGQPLDVLFDPDGGGVRLLSALTYVDLGSEILFS